MKTKRKELIPEKIETFEELFELMRMKVHNPQKEIDTVQALRIDFKEKIQTRTEKEIKEEAQKHPNLMVALCDITYGEKIRETTVRLLIAEVMKENGNEGEQS